MLLAMDVGNTNITLGRVADGDVAETWRLPTDTTGDLGAAIDELVGLERVTEAVMVSVVPSVSGRLMAVLASRGIATVVADHRTIPVPVHVDRPDQVGADRLVNAFAAVRLYGAPAIVVDLGTATTFDAVSPDGAFVGGAISPGIQLGLEALSSRTALLPTVKLSLPDHAIGGNTVEAMQSGIVIGYLGLVHELLARIEGELVADDAPGARVILTGGLSQAEWALDIFADEIDPELTLRGLALLHAEASAAAREETPA